MVKSGREGMQKIFFICMIYPVTERKNLIDLPYLDQGFI
jgi:hypothetical protein